MNLHPIHCLANTKSIHTHVNELKSITTVGYTFLFQKPAAAKPFVQYTYSGRNSLFTQVQKLPKTDSLYTCLWKSSPQWWVTTVHGCIIRRLSLSSIVPSTGRSRTQSQCLRVYRKIYIFRGREKTEYRIWDRHIKNVEKHWSSW